MSDQQLKLLCEELGLNGEGKEKIKKYIEKAIEESKKIKIEVVIGSFDNPSKIKRTYVFDKNEKMEELYFKLEELLEKEGCELYLGLDNWYRYNGKDIAINTCADDYYNETATLVSHFEVNGVLEILCLDLGDELVDELVDSEVENEVDNEVDNEEEWDYEKIRSNPNIFNWGRDREYYDMSDIDDGGDGCGGGGVLD